MARESGVTGSSGNGCGCGCGEMTTVSNAGDPCACGCACCADDGPKTPEQEIAELEALRESIDRRLSELAS